MHDIGKGAYVITRSEPCAGTVQQSFGDDEVEESLMRLLELQLSNRKGLFVSRRQPNYVTQMI